MKKVITLGPFEEMTHRQLMEEHLGWIWLVKMREGTEEVEDAWISENPRDSIDRAKKMYPNAKLVSCHRREEITNFSMVRCLLDGRVMGI